MASVIIPVKTSDNHSTSVSINKDIYDLLCADFKSEAECRAWIREDAFQRLKRKLTDGVRHACLMRIAKPSLVRRCLEREGQMDIEEI